MRRLAAFLVMLFALVATPSYAAKIVFTGGTNSGAGKIFKTGTGAEAIKVRASAWWFDAATVKVATLGVFSQGLGVTNPNDSNGSGGGNTHTVDNRNGLDFIVLQFDKKVTLSNATFSAFKQNGLTYTDTDATIGFGNTALLHTTQLSVANINAMLPGITSYESGNFGTQGTNTRDINPKDHYANLWIISASIKPHSQTIDNKIDSFKLASLEYTALPPVPEPGTWMMMLAGFGMVGSVMRRRNGLAAALA